MHCETAARERVEQMRKEWKHARRLVTSVTTDNWHVLKHAHEGKKEVLSQYTIK